MEDGRGQRTDRRVNYLNACMRICARACVPVYDYISVYDYVRIISSVCFFSCMHVSLSMPLSPSMPVSVSVPKRKKRKETCFKIPEKKNFVHSRMELSGVISPDALQE